MGRLGIPEMMIVLIFWAFYLIPLAAGIWALVTLHRLRVGQEDLRGRLQAIERALQRTGGD